MATCIMASRQGIDNVHSNYEYEVVELPPVGSNNVERATWVMQPGCLEFGNMVDTSCIFRHLVLLLRVSALLVEG
jgi:hypothetical protein